MLPEIALATWTLVVAGPVQVGGVADAHVLADLDTAPLAACWDRVWPTGAPTTTVVVTADRKGWSVSPSDALGTCVLGVASGWSVPKAASRKGVSVTLTFHAPPEPPRVLTADGGTDLSAEPWGTAGRVWVLRYVASVGERPSPMGPETVRAMVDALPIAAAPAVFLLYGFSARPEPCVDAVVLNGPIQPQDLAAPPPRGVQGCLDAGGVSPARLAGMDAAARTRAIVQAGGTDLLPVEPALLEAMTWDDLARLRGAMPGVRSLGMPDHLVADLLLAAARGAAWRGLVERGRPSAWAIDKVLDALEADDSPDQLPDMLTVYVSLLLGASGVRPGCGGVLDEASQEAFVAARDEARLARIADGLSACGTGLWASGTVAARVAAAQAHGAPGPDPRTKTEVWLAVLAAHEVLLPFLDDRQRARWDKTTGTTLAHGW